MNARRDPFLKMPLDGLRLIEASAGTGKTFTLATLALRLVIERGLRPDQILAVTFTEAATQELRERLRRRLLLAARIAGGADRGDEDAENVLTRTLIDGRLQQEDASALRARLQRAAHEIDLAAVFTIHGFCARALSEHALQTGQAFVAAEMIGSDRDLRDEVAADLWRAYGADSADAEALQIRWPNGPEALARDLGPLLRATRVLPPAPPTEPDPLPALRRAADTLCEAFARHGDEARSAIEHAIAAKILNGNSYRAALPAELWNALSAWAAHGDAVRTIDPRLDRLTPHCLRLRTNKGKEAATPASPLFEAVAAYLEVFAAREAWREAHALGLVHRLREDALQRLATLKRQRSVQTFDDLIDGVAAALDGPHGEALAEALRAQYAFALVDEFQDTDPRQWAIFERVFGARSLLLIGDPKQAIYRFRGGDVHTYLAAKANTEAAPPLEENFRSRPALLRAIAALYRRAGDGAFVDPRIAFREVRAGGGIDDADFLRDGRIAPALTVAALPPPTDGKGAHKADESRELAARACAAAIHALLVQARAGRATIGGEAVKPGDIAVLVREHREAARMQALLSSAGMPAVVAGRQSLFATEQAQELLTLFEALLQPGDDGRLRAALATVFVGLEAADIARLDEDQGEHRRWQLRALTWRERWQRHGPLALIADLCAEQAPRLLALTDGERRLANLLQLGEALQEMDVRALGLPGLVDALRRRIAEADPDDETQQLRLESDAQRVQILTVHKSKGLEFPLVFLPFAGIGKDRRAGGWCEYQDAVGRVLRLRGESGEADTLSWEAAAERASEEERAEDARLLYVALTRARQAVWIAAGALYCAEQTPLAAMVGDPATLMGDEAHDIAIVSGESSSALSPLPPEDAGVLPPARIAHRALSRDWWIYSFTQLTGEASSAATAPDDGEHGAEDEPEPVVTATDWRFSGSRFGNALHMALERTDFAAWRGWRAGEPPPPGQAAPLTEALRAEGYADADLDDGMAQLSLLVGNTLTAALPERVSLCELPAAQRRAEMEFHFALAPVSAAALLALLHEHGVLPDRQLFGARRRIEGLMTGKIDLVYARDDRYFLLDYKSNRLPGYDAAALAAAMAGSEYTLQALIYTLALHRWLRFRLGENYDYGRDFGGVRYLFCRGLDGTADGTPGIYADKPPQALIEALDALFVEGGGA